MAIKRKYHLRTNPEYQRLWGRFGRITRFHIYNVLRQNASKHDIELFRRTVLRLKSAGLLAVVGCTKIKVRGTSRTVNLYQLV